MQYAICKQVFNLTNYSQNHKLKKHAEKKQSLYFHYTSMHLSTTQTSTERSVLLKKKKLKQSDEYNINNMNFTS